MRAGWFKVGILAVVLVMVVAGYLVGRSTDNGGGGEPRTGESRSHPVRVIRGRGAFLEQVEAVRAALSGAGSTEALKTEPCPTLAAVPGGSVRRPGTVSARIPEGPSPRLVAFAAANGTFLAARSHWECAASVGVDGTEEISAGPKGSVTINHAMGNWELPRGDTAVRELLVPACAGCIASDICSFFPHAEVVKLYRREEPCKKTPEVELRLRLSRSTFVFIDPPGVRGSSIGGGGALPTMSALSYSRGTGLRQLSCTIATSKIDTCTSAIVAFVSLGPGR